MLNQEVRTVFFKSRKWIVTSSSGITFRVSHTLSIRFNLQWISEHSNSCGLSHSSNVWGQFFHHGGHLKPMAYLQPAFCQYQSPFLMNCFAPMLLLYVKVVHHLKCKDVHFWLFSLFGFWKCNPILKEIFLPDPDSFFIYPK